MASARFETAIPAIKRLQNNSSDRTATGIGYCIYNKNQIIGKINFKKAIHNQGYNVSILAQFYKMN
jgi:hypothetical protein